MRISRPTVRFLVEAAFLCGVAGILVATDPGWLVVVVTMTGAWFVCLVVERASARHRVPTSRRQRLATALQARRERRASAAEQRAAAAAREAERQRLAALSVQRARERPPEPTVEVAPPPPPQPPPVEEPAAPPAPLRATTAREWNLWELEALARSSGGSDPERDLVLLHLRPYASPQGVLPADFDDLVRETFGELLAERA